MSNKTDRITREQALAEFAAALRTTQSPSGGTAFSAYDREKILGAAIGLASRCGRPIDRRKFADAIAAIQAVELADRPTFEAAVFGTRAEVEAERAWNDQRAKDERKRGPRLGSALRPRDPARTYHDDDEPDYDPPAGKPEPKIVRAPASNPVDYTRVQEAA